MKKLILMLMLIAPMAIHAQKVGIVDIDAVAQALPEFAKAEGELKALQTQAQNDLKSMQDEIQRKYQEYQKGASTMNATAKEQKEKELQDLGQKYDQAAQAKSQELQKAQQEKIQPIYAKVNQAISNVGKAGKYTFIMLKGSQPYISDTLVTDVTEQCKTEVTKIK